MAVCSPYCLVLWRWVMSDVKGRLMSYPKEVLVDYLLDGPLLFEIDFDRLDFRAKSLRQEKLLVRYSLLVDEASKAKGVQWFAIQEEITTLIEHLQKLSDDQSRLLGLSEVAS